MKNKYLTNNSKVDRGDYTLILDSLGDLDYLSTCVLKDVINLLQNEIDNRPVVEEVEPGSWAEESPEDMAKREGRVLDEQERRT